VLLLLAVCVIPFALAQRNTTRQSAARTAAESEGGWQDGAESETRAARVLPGWQGSATASRSTYSAETRKVSTSLPASAPTS